MAAVQPIAAGHVGPSQLGESMTESDRLYVLAFATRDELTRYFGRLDRYLAQRLGTDYARRCPELELWADTDCAADLGRGGGPGLYMNEALIDLVRWGRLGRLPAAEVARAELPRHAWPVLGPHAYPRDEVPATSRTGMLEVSRSREPQEERPRPV